MRCGVVGGIMVSGVLLVSLPFLANEGPLYVNDSLVDLIPQRIQADGTPLVPLVEFGRIIGIEAMRSDDGREFILRWRSRRSHFDAERFPLRNGIFYAGLDWIVGLVEGKIHRLGDAIYVEVDRPALDGVEATENRLVLRFSGFVPETGVRSEDGTELRLTFANCRCGVSPQWIVLGATGIRSVRLQAQGPGEVEVLVALEGELPLRIERSAAADFYSFTVEITERPEEESILELGGLTVHDLTTSFSGGRMVEAEYLVIESWRTRYRLAPAFPAAGLGSEDSIEAIAQHAAADVAISLGCRGGGERYPVLVIGGIPYAVSDGACDVVGIDLFGRWEVFSSVATVYAKHAGTRIPIDGVNRAVAYGEAVAYPPGYEGIFARGVPGSFTVMKIRSGRVVSIHEGPFIFSDPTATLIVASGEARGRFSLVQLGDPLSLGCNWSGSDRTIVHAFPAGPMLIQDGRVTGASVSSDSEDPSRVSVLATDWHGGMILLSLSRESPSVVTILDDVVALLGRLPVPIKNAAVLHTHDECAFAVRNPSSCDRFGSKGSFALALCLLPLAP